MTDELRFYLESTIDLDPNLEQAYEDAHEFGLPVPDIVTGRLLTTLTAATQAQAAITVTPAANVVGLYLLAGLGNNGILTCIDPEPEHQQFARQAFRAPGYSPSRIRFLPSRPIDVMGRLASHSYQLIYAEVSPVDLKALVNTALPLLTPGGSIILPDVLFGGALIDEARTDRDTVAAREADEYICALEGVYVTRLPLGSGMTIITKLS